VHIVFALAALITDESVRLRVLEAIFPKMHVTATPTRSIDDSFRPRQSSYIFFDDALKREPVYRVTGPPHSEIDRCAAEHLGTLARSNTREVRVLVFQWPGFSDQFLVIAQYRYLGALPAFACESIVRLYRTGLDRVFDETTLETTHHTVVNAVRLVDSRLHIESDLGGGGSHLSEFLAFDLSEAKFRTEMRTVSVALNRSSPWQNGAIDTLQTS